MSNREELARLREERTARERAAANAAEAREIEVLRLEDKLTTELGPRGEAFEIVETVDGPIAVKLGPGVLHSRFENSKLSSSDVDDYVRPCLAHPDAARYSEIVDKRPGVAMRCALALASLFGTKASSDAGKF